MRHLLVTSCFVPGKAALHHLSRPPYGRYQVWGTSENIARLFEAPEGARVEGRFIAYFGTLPRLRIADLERPEARAAADVP